MDEKTDIVFLLGAGASIKAGVPDTTRFVEDFKKYIESGEDRDKKSTIKKIIKILSKWGKRTVDIELLLEALTKLRDKKEEPLLQFYKNNDANFILKEYSEKEPLIEDLKNYIKKRAIVTEDKKVEYLSPFIDFIDEKADLPKKHLNIITLNYDTCIEQFCNMYKLTYRDGFDDRWSPSTFDAENIDICLYKLHGSVTWYRTDKGDCIKLPIDTIKFQKKNNSSVIPLISGENAESLMLYPMQKLDYAEPVLELLVKIKHILESECKFLIVIGYSFRDDHIKRIILDAARKNKNMNLILVSPDAFEIYFEKLKYYENTENKVPSSLDGRVICLPYKFEDVFKNIRNHYLKYLKKGIEDEKNLRINNLKMSGTVYDSFNTLPMPTPESVIISYLDSSHFEKAEKLFNEYSDDSELVRFNYNSDYNKVEFRLIYFLNMVLFNQKAQQIQNKNKIEEGEEDYEEKTKKGFNYLFDLLKKITVQNTEIYANDKNICINFCISLENNCFKIYTNNLNDITEVLNNYNRELVVKSDSFNDNNIKLKKFSEYLNSFRNGCIEFQKYIDSEFRKGKISEKIKNTLLSPLEQTGIEEIKSEIKNTEIKIIEDLLN